MKNKTPDGWFSVSEVARLLGSSRAGLNHHIRAGTVPEPTAVLKKRRYYLAEDVQRIRAFWASRVPVGCSRFTAADVERMRRLWADGMRQADIAALFNATQTNVSQLLTGVVLPGWRGGGTGHGRKRRVQKRRRNTGVNPAVGPSA